ncbi:Na(+)/citrate cotransporter-like [Haemaphysalis longicornis]
MVTVTLMLFMIPRETDVTGGDEEGIIKWEDVCQKVDWGTMLLVCGGLTIAKAATKSGLSARMVGALDYLEPIPASMVAASLCILASIMTELTSNRAVGRLLVPVVLEAAHYRNVHPLYFGLPTTIGCSFAFMLPCGTPPNAIVFNAGHMTTGDMVKPGIIMNGMCVIFQFAALHTLGTYLFNLNSFPEWAHQIVYQD